MKILSISLITILLIFSYSPDLIAKKAVKLAKLQEASQLSNPESAYYDLKTKQIFVSNIVGSPVGKDNKGWISILNGKGILQKEKWVEGLNAPKGIRSFNDLLYVADIDQVVEIHIPSAKITKRYPIKGAEFLNDVAIDKNGIVYVSDMFNGKVYQIAKKKVSVFLTASALKELPNGLYIQGNNLFIASWGREIDKTTFATKKSGRLLKVNLDNKNITPLTKEFGNLDGLEMTSSGDFLVSDWVHGKIFKVNQKGEVSLIHQGKQGLADIGLVRGTNSIIVPQMLENKAYILKQK
ncbi:MAG: hypothetical protein AB8G05_24090 [Oligoflexales bacterium]